MTHAVRPLLALLLALVLAACGSPGSPGGGNGDEPPTTEDPLPLAGNNGGVLDGVLLGSAEAPTEQLRAEIPVTLTTPHPTLEVASTAYLTRSSTTTDTAAVIFEVTNFDTRPHCFVRAEEVTFERFTLPSVTTDFDYVTGSVGRVGSGASATFTATCLDAGESGWFLTLPGSSADGALYTEIESVRIAALTSDPAPDAEHAGRLRPDGIAVVSGDLGDRLEVDGLNDGELTLAFNPFSTYVLLDENDEPLEWGFLDAPEGTLAPGESGTWVEPALPYEGSADALLVRFDFEAASAGQALRACAPEGDAAGRADRLEARDRAIAAQHAGTACTN